MVRTVWAILRSRIAQRYPSLRIGWRCRRRCRCGLLWRRCLRGRCRRSSLWRRCWRRGFWRWCRSGLGCWRRRRRRSRRWLWRRGRSRSFSLRWLWRGRGGLGFVPIHEIGSNHESKDDASQDDSEERPTAGLVVVCHIVVLPLEGRWSRRGRAYRVIHPGSRLVPGNAPISGAYAQAKALPVLLSTAYRSVGCTPRLKSGVSPMAREKFTSIE